MTSPPYKRGCPHLSINLGHLKGGDMKKHYAVNIILKPQREGIRQGMG